MDAYLNCTDHDACDGVGTIGEQLDPGCGDGEHKCKERDSDDYPVRFAVGGRVETNPITVFDATPSNLPAGTFGYSLRYSSHYGRWLATRPPSEAVPRIIFEPYDTNFVGYGFLDNFSDRLLRRVTTTGATQYVWVRDRDVITFDAVGAGQYKSRGAKYGLVDQGGTSSRFIITTTSTSETRQRWTFDTFVYSPPGVTPAPQLYILATYKVNVDGAGAGGYGWTVTRFADARVDKVIDTLGHELRLVWDAKHDGPTTILFYRLAELKYAANAADSGTSVAVFDYFSKNNLERIEFGPSRYVRFTYDKSNIDHCDRCGHLLTSVIYPFAAGATPTLGASLLPGEVVTEGHEYEYFTSTNGFPRYRAQKSFGPARSWFYDWPSVDENSSVTQLDLNQAHATDTCGSCASGFSCYPTSKGGDDKCYVSKTLTIDIASRNVTASTGTFGGSFAYGSSSGGGAGGPVQAPTIDTDPMGRKTTYGYSTSGDIRCIVRGDDDGQPFATPASPDTSACAGPSTAQIVRVDYTATTTTKTTPSLLSGSVTEIETRNAALLQTSVATTGQTRNISGTVVSQTKTTTSAYDALGRVLEDNGPLTDSAFLDKATVVYYTSFDAAWPHNLGHVQSVTKYVGTSTSNTPITTTYAQYDIYGVPHLVAHPNSVQVTYAPSTDRLTWTITTTGTGVSVVKLNPDGTVASLQDGDGFCMQYEYSDATGYVGAPTKIRRAYNDCATFPINENSLEVEVRTYANHETDRLLSVTRKLNGVTQFTYSGFTYDRDRRATSASTIHSAQPFIFAFTDTLPSGTTAPGAPAAGTWRTDTTADNFGRPTSLSRFIDATNKQTYNYSYSTSFTPRPTQMTRGFNGSATSTTTFAYDDFGRLVETVVPESGPPGSPSPTRYEYDLASRMTLKRVGVGTGAVRTSAYSYDSLGRTTFVDHDTEHPVNCASAPSGTPIQDEEYKYDSCTGDAPAGVSCANALGHLTISRAVSECGSSTTIKQGRWYSYDSAGRIASVSYATMTGSSYGTPATRSQTYTTGGRLSAWTSPLTSSFGTRYLYGGTNGLPTVIRTHSNTSISPSITYRSFGPVSSLSTEVIQPVVKTDTRRLKLNATYNTDDSLATLTWGLYPNTGTPTPIYLTSQTMSYTQAGALSNRADSADTGNYRFYGYDALMRLTCEARHSGTLPPSASDCVTTSTKLAGLFTYGDGQSTTSPADVRLSSFIKGAGTVGASYTSPSIETYSYSNGSGQPQQITRTGSNIVIGHDLLGRRTFDYSTADVTKSRRDYTYLPNGQLGTIAGKTSANASYTIVIRYDSEGHPIKITNGSSSYELFWDESNRLIAASINGGAIRWHYHYQGKTLVAATREVGVAVKRFWFVTDERGLPHRLLDEQGATFWQARWDASGWRQIVGTPQADMWIPFGLGGQLLLEGTGAFSGTSTTTVRPEVALNRWRAYDSLVGQFLQRDPLDENGRRDPGGYTYAGSSFPNRTDTTGLDPNLFCTQEQNAKLRQAVSEAIVQISKCHGGECSFKSGEIMRRAWLQSLENVSFVCLTEATPQPILDLFSKADIADVSPFGTFTLNNGDLAGALSYPTYPSSGSVAFPTTMVVVHPDASARLGSASCLRQIVAHELLHTANKVVSADTYFGENDATSYDFLKELSGKSINDKLVDIGRGISIEEYSVVWTTNICIDCR